eukprot:scaffold2290_cov170-Amphora_coffeaeformis.AAC.11
MAYLEIKSNSTSSSWHVLGQPLCHRLGVIRIHHGQGSQMNLVRMQRHAVLQGCQWREETFIGKIARL